MVNGDEFFWGSSIDPHKRKLPKHGRTLLPTVQRHFQKDNKEFAFSTD